MSSLEEYSHHLHQAALVFYSIWGHGTHPRFLIHDSPREADLDRNVYNYFLNIVAEISEILGGGSKAPFQYIVTTTSKPPAKIQKLIRAELCGNPEKELLFGCRLGFQDEQEEIEFNLT